MTVCLFFTQKLTTFAARPSVIWHTVRHAGVVRLTDVSVIFILSPCRRIGDFRVARHVAGR